jgi:hypothetical protein
MKRSFSRNERCLYYQLKATSLGHSSLHNFRHGIVDNSGSGDLFTASSSGLNRFVITQAGNVGYWDNVPRETRHVLGRFAVPIGHG